MDYDILYNRNMNSPNGIVAKISAFVIRPCNKTSVSFRRDHELCISISFPLKKCSNESMNLISHLEISKK